MPVQLAALLPGVEAVAGQLELPLGLAALPLLLVPVGQGAGVAVAAVPATVGLGGRSQAANSGGLAQIKEASGLASYAQFFFSKNL